MLERQLNQRDNHENTGYHELRSSLLVAVRTCLLAVALVAASIYGVYVRHESWASISYFYPHFALLFGFCALSGLWIAWKTTGTFFICLQFAVDIAVVTGVVYATGGPISPLIFLYLPIVMGAAVVSSVYVALGITVLNLAAYAALLWGLSSGQIPMFDEGAVLELPRQGLIWQFCGLACAMVLVGAASSYLRRKIWAEHAIATQSSKDLAELHSRQKSLIEGLADGVIITDNSGTIFSINQAACGLLQVSEQESVGQPLRQLCKNLPTNGEELFIDNAGEGSFEFEITPSASSEPIKIVFSRRAILDGAGTNLGSVCIFRNVTELRTAEEQLALQERMAEMLAKQHEPTSLHPLKLHGFTGESAVMHKVLALIERVAASDANVLISGESGTGKELAARAIHHGGARARAPFIAVNCGAVPETLIESQLFGHKKGSFTGADADQSGLFKQAHTGTLFLDEIAELPLLLQSKLLRAIQEKTIRPIGADREMPIDVRIIAATNKTLKQEVAAGKFREDLYYRLNVVGINLPPLRNRKEDIPLLVNSILKRLIKGSATPLVPPATMQILMNYDYPGNVRELENLLERAVVLGGEVLLPEHLPEHLRCEESTLPDEEAKPKETRIIIDEQLELPVDLDALLSTIEKKYLEVALLKTNGVKKKAADLLGMNFRSFRYRLQKFGMAE